MQRVSRCFQILSNDYITSGSRRQHRCRALPPSFMIFELSFTIATMVTLFTCEHALVLSLPGKRRQIGKCDVMHSFHVMFQILPLSISIVKKVAFELARRRFSCYVMGLLLVNISILFAREAFLALVTLKLALVFCWSTRLRMVFLVVGV